MSLPSATIIQDLVQLRLSPKTVTVATPCSQCDSLTQEEDIFVADRLPEVLAVGLEGSEHGCAHYRHDILIDYRQLEQGCGSRLWRSRYSLVGLLHISGKAETAHITTSNVVQAGFTSMIALHLRLGLSKEMRNCILRRHSNVSWLYTHTHIISACLNRRLAAYSRQYCLNCSRVSIGYLFCHLMTCGCGFGVVYVFQVC
jgi:hypothetical protein